MSYPGITGIPPVAGDTSGWPDIPLQPGLTIIGRSPSCAVCFAHNSVSRRHAQLEFDGRQLVVKDLDSRGGTFVNGNRISVYAMRPGDFLRIGASPPYQWIGGMLHAMPEAVGMGLRLRDVGVIRGGRPLLIHANAMIEPGRFVGLLGPSGAGKSLLLGCLSSALIPSTGSLCFDGGCDVREHAEYYRSRIGVVTQDDLVYDELTVTENLRLAAVIRLPAFSGSERKHRVQDAIEKVGLAEHARKRTVVLSGGQRKRLSVGVELLSHPRLLLLDEPTSGLDPGMQARVMETLRQLSRQGMTVVCSTHTMDTLNFFDTVIVLGLIERCATIVYNGTPRHLLTAFNVANPADLFERLAKLPGAHVPGESMSRTAPQGELDVPRNPASAPRWATLRTTQANRRSHPLGQAAVVWWRAILGLWRDKGSLLFALLQPPILAVLIAFSQPANAPSSYAHFFAVMAALWLGMTVTVREIVRERKLYARDRLAGLRPTAYLAGKMFYALCVTAVQTLLLYSGIRLFAVSWINTLSARTIHDVPPILGYGLLTAVGFGGCLLGFILSTLSKTERAAVALLPLVLLPQVVLSRVTYGDGDKPWGFPSPYSPIAFMARSYEKSYQPSRAQLERYRRVAPSSQTFVRSTAPAPGNRHKRSRLLLSIGSLPMLTRPGTAALDMLATSKISARRFQWIVWEDVYLVALLVVYGIALYGFFRRRERAWLNTRG